jgi:hypothetical protein
LTSESASLRAFILEECCREEGMIPERKPPTFWPLSPDDEMQMTVAVRSLEEENIELKELVVRLSEPILRDDEGH